MKNMFVFMLKGAYDNVVRILFAVDRKTSLPMRKMIVSGGVAYPKTVNDAACIGCGACANTCPVKAIEMVPLEAPVEITPTYVKERRPVLDPLKCMFCFQCHDNCPIFAFYGKPGAIHPRCVGEWTGNIAELLQQPIVMRDSKEYDAVIALLDEKARGLLKEGH
ncbi:MAG: 4Fe-4S dicluster domain-containing protein [Candidatus Methanofastidiosa archaeon]|nr:4Fe-4S dicluster domain-containing protein [Candidatus Methanofastidiosa archaeon]